MLSDLPVKDERLQQIKAATLEDQNLSLLKQVIMQGWPNDRDEVLEVLRPFFSYRDELTVQDGIIMRGERILIPSSLRKEIKQKLHAGHLGINSCLRRARELVFWPGMSSEIRQFIESCDTSATLSTRQSPEPLFMRPVPERPWQDVATDIFTWEDRDYLVTADCFS